LTAIPSDLEIAPLPFAVISGLLGEALTVLRTSKPLLEVPAPVVIVGDLHGSIVDLLRILRQFGSSARYLFLGDYVDRGPDSVGVISLALALMCAHPDRVFLIRGNHEFAPINQAYGFLAEVRSKYADDALWNRFQEVFSWLPLAAVVDGTVFCVHGGISPALEDLGTLLSIELPIAECASGSLAGDLVWSDPVDGFWGFQTSTRGSGVIFGHDRVAAFLKRTNLRLIIRAHQCVDRGWETFARAMGITVFSAGNYCGMKNNSAVLALLDGGELEAFTFDRECGAATLPTVWQIAGEGNVGVSKVPQAQLTKHAVAEADTYGYALTARNN
jgi:diadenosine tetraphosphatase ApaH/serine/threonine PP2A family protein phosphatase